ncbi:MAG TPA: thioredoxin family protein [Smithellaceae bacterium]|jgi:small redox-active disulfide protein 2|nr:thioredoxin family protein [Smithella sp.]HPL48305.1 thioredoxin family protein [Smithella sp.]HPL97664.1 thioredoxin family protein [Smithellaceae bacterium]
MKIEILGVGCAKCHKLEEMVRDIASEEGIDADISKVEDFKKIITYGVMTTPALVVNGDVKVAGKIPSEDQIKSWLKNSKSK